MSDVLDHEWFCDRAEAEITRMAAVLAAADPALPVPACPEWTVARLITHTGFVHRWATTIVSTGATAPVSRRDIDMGLPAGEAAYAGWLAAGAAPLAGALRAAGPDTPVWTWGPSGRSGWWARRMVHETTVHRADAEAALGRVPVIDPEAAVDGISELLSILPHGSRPSERLPGLPAGESLHLHATDADGEWLIRLGDGGYRWERGHGKATVAVRGPAGVLLLFGYGRVPPSDERLTVFGEAGLAEAWQRAAAL